MQSFNNDHKHIEYDYITTLNSKRREKKEERLPTLGREPHNRRTSTNLPLFDDKDYLKNEYTASENGKLVSMTNTKLNIHKLKENPKLMEVSDLSISNASSLSSPHKSKVEIYNSIISFTQEDVTGEYLYDFLMLPLPKDVTLVCQIVTSYNSKIEQLFPKYEVRINSNNKIILSAQKIFQTTSTVYLISANNKDNCVISERYIGKISSNLFGNSFSFYDHGKKYNKTKNIQEHRLQYGYVSYDINIFGRKGPRNMKVLLPSLNERDEIDALLQMKKSDSFEELNKLQNERVIVFRNKQPEWSNKYSAYTLNFNGRVECESPKNFQLIEEGKDGETILQFGKINDKTYAMDFRYPLSPFQAFAICLSSLATKIVCE